MPAAPEPFVLAAALPGLPGPAFPDPASKPAGLLSSSPLPVLAEAGPTTSTGEAGATAAAKELSATIGAAALDAAATLAATGDSTLTDEANPATFPAVAEGPAA